MAEVPDLASSDKPYVAPALYHHCVKTYEAMLRRSKILRADSDIDDEELVDEDDDGGMVVYEGPLTQLITGDLHLSVPYYTHITRALKHMGCIRQLRRGGGSSDSQWELLREPSEGLFRSDVPVTRTPGVTKAAMHAAQIGELTNRVQTLEDFMDAVVKHFGTEGEASE